MDKDQLGIREIQKEDIDFIIHYWLDSETAFLEGMGVDLSKIPSRDQWEQMLNEQLNQSYPEKKSYCLIWLMDGKAIGHSNVNKIIFGEEAYMHLHIWENGIRKKGMGTALVKMGLPLFFKNLQLKKIYCEPYALNPAPNKVLGKAGFEFVKTYITTPGFLNFEQPVNFWELTYDRFVYIAQE
jgi:RimJ/RimL family protein N-acetyltransferase